MVETEKRELLGAAAAVVYAAVNEDFGLVPIEAYASGTPVIGVRDGYTKYQIQDGATGILFNRGVDNLAKSIERFAEEGVTADEADLVELADAYGVERFREQIRTAVAGAVDHARIEVTP